MHLYVIVSDLKISVCCNLGIFLLLLGSSSCIKRWFLHCSFYIMRMWFFLCACWTLWTLMHSFEKLKFVLEWRDMKERSWNSKMYLFLKHAVWSFYTVFVCYDASLRICMIQVVMSNNFMHFCCIPLFWQTAVFFFMSLFSFFMHKFNYCIDVEWLVRQYPQEFRYVYFPKMK